MEKHSSEKIDLNNQKAGLPKDPNLLAFIDRIIKETTKDSEYYNKEQLWNSNQKSKIERLKSRLAKTNHNILSCSTRRANELIHRFKARQDPVRTWLHIDMDMFFCAVAQKLDPSLSNIPFVVGRSIVASANYITRGFGVSSAIPVSLAEKIVFEVQKYKGIKEPIELKSVNDNPKEQSRIAGVIRNITKKYSNNFYSLGDDEISFDVTEYLFNKTNKNKSANIKNNEINRGININIENKHNMNKSTTNIVKHTTNALKDKEKTNKNLCVKNNQIITFTNDKENIKSYLDYKEATISLIKNIRHEIFLQTGLPASIGAGNNKLVAKIAADHNKPNSFYFVDDQMSFIKDLKVRKVTGIGKATEFKLNKLGIQTVGDLHEKRDVIFHLFKGIERTSLLLKGVGIDEDNVCETKKESGYSNFGSKAKTKSIGRSCTFRKCNDKDVLISILATLCHSIFKQMKSSCSGFKSVKVSLQTVKLVTYFKTTTFKFVVNSEEYLVNEVMRIIELLFRSIDLNNNVKLKSAYKHRYNINKENESILKLKRNRSTNVFEFEYVRFFCVRITNLKDTDFGKQQTNLDYYIK
eukprot:GAHX01002561.1.p1 GENE.GAHX01002561.1~~GAHX01002561.1.p1  ORF type:complete len:594 (-),score=136.74 GAHX01002561.1:41-1783(-)